MNSSILLNKGVVRGVVTEGSFRQFLASNLSNIQTIRAKIKTSRNLDFTRFQEVF